MECFMSSWYLRDLSELLLARSRMQSAVMAFTHCSVLADIERVLLLVDFKRWNPVRSLGGLILRILCVEILVADPAVKSRSRTAPLWTSLFGRHPLLVGFGRASETGDPTLFPLEVEEGDNDQDPVEDIGKDRTECGGVVPA